jgi:hypothetical protein
MNYLKIINREYFFDVLHIVFLGSTMLLATNDNVECGMWNIG